MKLLKTILAMFLFFSLFTAGYCDDEENCDDCIDAQRHYCLALLDHSCSTTSVSEANGMVLDKCTNGAAKAAAIRSNCQLGNNLGCGGFTCD